MPDLNEIGTQNYSNGKKKKKKKSAVFLRNFLDVIQIVSCYFSIICFIVTFFHYLTVSRCL